RNAKPAAQPFLSAGRTSATDNTWTSEVTGLGIAVALKVDTSKGQFRAPPRYFAHAIGDRQVTLTLKNNEQRTLILDGFARVIEASSLRFTFSLLIPTILIPEIVINS